MRLYRLLSSYIGQGNGSIDLPRCVAIQFIHAAAITFCLCSLLPVAIAQRHFRQQPEFSDRDFQQLQGEIDRHETHLDNTDKLQQELRSRTDKDETWGEAIGWTLLALKSLGLLNEFTRKRSASGASE